MQVGLAVIPRTASVMLFWLLLLATAKQACTACIVDLDCSLNGVCAGGLCQCDKPWGGAKCGIMQYAVTPAAGKDLYVSAWRRLFDSAATATAA